MKRGLSRNALHFLLLAVSVLGIVVCVFGICEIRKFNHSPELGRAKRLLDLWKREAQATNDILMKQWCADVEKYRKETEQKEAK